MRFPAKKNAGCPKAPCDFPPRKDGILCPRRVLLGLPSPSHRVCGRMDVRTVRDISISGYIFSCDVIGPDQIKTKQVWPRETGTSYEAIRKFCQAAILKYTKHIQD